MSSFGTVEAQTHTVRRGDNDWTVAKRYGITPKQLRDLNPGVDFRRLQINQRLTVGVPKPKTVAKPKPKSTPSLGRYAVVNRDSVTIRSTPSMRSRQIGSLDKGRRAYVIGARGDWVHLQFAEGGSGWVRRDLLARTATAPARIAARPTPPAQPKAIVATANVHAEEVAPVDSSIQIEVVGQAPAAAAPVVTPVALSVEVEPDPAPVNSTVGNRIVTQARKWLGVRYRFGASSRSSTDCSGYTMQVMRSVGISIPRTSAAQARAGRPVSRGQLQPGDLVFFRTRGNRISHVGIYVGKNRFIHASSGSRQVRESGLGEAYYSKRYVTARRVSGG
jgi:cell wall-associated NlpC family hydrolase